MEADLQIYVASDLVLTLNLELEPAQHVVYQGELADISVGRLAKGETQGNLVSLQRQSGAAQSLDRLVWLAEITMPAQNESTVLGLEMNCPCWWVPFLQQ